jgi:hypothetical protein
MRHKIWTIINLLPQTVQIHSLPHFQSSFLSNYRRHHRLKLKYAFFAIGIIDNPTSKDNQVTIDNKRFTFSNLKRWLK